ncbi:sensor histidine kinase [Dactylosporangium sp. NBC_01737]|uniref:sensor histidine kinase n=1 Tax=Dactylosporangium sp. NBC_01737 TaxID=2975959 RepID=UPI002E15FA4C|nr:sensor histidine kinase [Dactylosporangium sp. NBC_01737]
MHRAAWATLAIAGVACWLAIGNGAPPAGVSHLLSVAACAVAGGLVLRQRPANPLGRLLLLGAACFVLLEAFGQYAIRGLPGATAAAWPQTWLWVPANLGLAALPAFFPDGRPGRWMTRALWGVTALGVAAAVTGALRPGRNDQVGPDGLPNPIGVAALQHAAPAAEAAFTVCAGLLFVAGAAGVVAEAVTATGARRAQARWLAYSIGLVALVVLGRLAAGLTDGHPDRIWPYANPWWDFAGSVSLAFIPAGIGVAVLRHRLFDIDLLISRTAVFVVLTGGVSVAYLVIVGYLGASSVVAAVAAALVFGTARQQVQRRVNLLVYGERDDPYTVLARLGERLAQVQDPLAVLATSTATVREALQLSYVRIDAEGGRSYEIGSRPADPVRLPLVAGGVTVGALLIGPRPGEAALGPRDLRLLTDVARHIGPAVQAGRFAADLQRSREQLVQAREEERRRLRRDLHDGLGPTLAGLTMRAEAALALGAAREAQDLLEEIVRDAETAVADVRRLVEGLRPPALDTLGLRCALTAHLAGWPPGGPRVGVDAPDDLPALPAAVEVAAYRIAVEALANARRHAGATAVRLGLRLDDGWLHLSVTDDGRSTGAAAGTGVGMHSMRERAAELGGTLDVASTGTGTTVSARLPMGEGA